MRIDYSEKDGWTIVQKNGSEIQDKVSGIRIEADAEQFHPVLEMEILSVDGISINPRESDVSIEITSNAVDIIKHYLAPRVSEEAQREIDDVMSNFNNYEPIKNNG